MPAFMFDSDDPALLLEPFLAGTRVATYADLLTTEIIDALAGRLIVIDRGLGDPHNLATVADIEPGALTLEAGTAKIRQWLEEKRPQPTAYHDRNDQQAVDQHMAGMPVFNWVATLDGTLVPNGYRRAVVQFANANVLGFHADASIVWDDGWRPVRPSIPAAQLAALKAMGNDIDGRVAALVSAVGRL